MKKAKGHRELQGLFKIHSKYFPRALSLLSTEITAGRKLEYSQNDPKGISTRRHLHDQIDCFQHSKVHFGRQFQVYVKYKSCFLSQSNETCTRIFVIFPST